MSTPQLRPAVAADAATLVAFNAAMAEETEGRTLDPEVLAAGVAAVLEEPANGFYLVAERDNAIVASLLITWEWSDWRNGRFWWIQSVYVAPAARRRGIFRALYCESERRARAAGAVGLRLYVERENTRAQATYADLGMAPCPYRMYEAEFAATGDAT